nr:carbohydrate ABC transporter permease [Propionicimonas sp.]
MRGLWRGLLAGLLGLALVATVFPLYWTFLLSLKPRDVANANPPQFIFPPTTGNYGATFWVALPYLANSIVVAIATVALSVAAGTLGAYALAKFAIRGKERLMFVILTTLLVPPIIIAIPLYYLSVRIGIQGSLLAVILAQALFNTPFVVWMMRSFFEDVPKELDEAARIDGANEWQIFWAVALPIVRPGIAAAATLSAFYSWNEFLLAKVLSTSGSQTLPAYLATFQRDTSQILWEQLGATIMLGIIPVVVCTFLAQPFLVRGMAFGAVKG